MKPFPTKGLIIVVVVSVLMLVSIAIYAIPSLANALVKEKIERMMTGTYGISQIDRIEVGSHFSGLISGVVDSIHISGDNIVFRGINAETLDIKLDGLHFDVVAAVLDRKAKIEGVDDANAKIQVGESAIRDYLSKRFQGSGMESWEISLRGDTIEAVKTIPFIGSAIVKLQPVIKGDYVVLRTTDVSFSGNKTISAMLDYRPTEEISTNIAVSGLPFDMRIKRIDIRQGRIDLIADNKS